VSRAASPGSCATFPLDDYRQAFAAARAQGRSGKVLFALDGVNP
jgi:hypothetical protein